MKRKIILCFFIIIMLLILYIQKSFGAITDVSAEMKTFDSGTNRDSDVLKYLKDTYGYDGNSIPKELKVEGTLTIGNHPNTTGGSSGYDVYFTPKNTSSKVALNNTSPNVAGVSDTSLKEKFGYPQDQVNINESWDGVIVVNVSEGGSSANNTLNYQIGITKLYTGSDYETGANAEVDSSPAETTASHNLQEGQDNAQNVFDFIGNFTKNPAGTLFTVLFDGLLRIIDVIQMAANFFETIPLKTSADYTVVYEFNYLLKDGNASSSSNVDVGAGHRNMYTEVSAGYVENGKSSWQTQSPVNVDIENANTDETEYGFSTKTLIPVIPVDVFTIAKGNIALFDPNFLIVDTSIHTDSNSIWFTIRKIATIAIRGLIYITAGVLVAGLIWHGIHLIWGTITPNQRRDHLNGIHTFVTSLLLLIGTLIIIALGIYINKMFSSYNNIDQGRVELPIRVNVKEADYSFSTTQTGVIRYLAQIENPNLIGRKIMYTIEYLVLAVINLIVALFFLARMILMMVGAGYGIVVVGARIIGQENILPINYQNWLIYYLSIALLQTALVFAYSIASMIT